MRQVGIRGGLLMMLWLAGCNAPTVQQLPAMNKVEGKVVRSGQPFTGGGGIEFRHETEPGRTCRGEIDRATGAFSLKTFSVQGVAEGVPEGSYAVTILTQAADQNIVPIHLTKRYQIAAGDNQLTIELDE